MAEERIQRKLAAILAADVAKYSLLMGTDETGTLRLLKRFLDDLIQPAVSKYRGRIVKLMGDGILAEFGSVVDAVECAVFMQQGTGNLNADVPADRQIWFRIGINLGDVILDGDDIYGDGVNVAARLEGLADPGGICLSASAQEHVRDKLDISFRDLGDQQLKNISRPVRAYRVDLASGDETNLGGVESPPSPPNRPSIAVLPFDNMSGDPEQEYFSDGLAEDLITDLSKIGGLFVPSRNSSFSFKGKSMDIQEIARRLKVSHVLEGSVRKMNDRLRITAQLIDATDGGHVWAERFDGMMVEIFDFQDRIREEIVTALKLQLTPGDDAQRASQRPKLDVEAYDLYLQGRAQYYRYTPENNAKAEQLLLKALEIDPDQAEAYAYLARCILGRWIQTWPGHDADVHRAVKMAERAVAIDQNSVLGYMMLAFVLAFARDERRSEENFQRALFINPNNSEVYVTYAASSIFWGDREKSLKLLERARAIDPVDHPNAKFSYGQYSYLTRDYDQAVQILTDVIERQPGFNPASLHLAAAYIAMGKKQEAGTVIEKMLAKNPSYTVADADRVYPYKLEGDRTQFLDALRSAGLPEG
jgi:adenylate cyclase